MGMIGAAFGIGFIIGPLIGGVLKHNYGIQMVGYVSAALICIDFILAIFLLPESNKNAKKIAFGFLKKRSADSEPGDRHACFSVKKQRSMLTDLN